MPCARIYSSAYMAYWEEGKDNSGMRREVEETVCGRCSGMGDGKEQALHLVLKSHTVYSEGEHRILQTQLQLIN